MINKSLLAATVALFLTPSTKASYLTNLFSSAEDKEGLIELDLTHHSAEEPTLNDSAMQLMNLREQAPGAQPSVLPYIEKDLHDFFKI